MANEKDGGLPQSEGPVAYSYTGDGEAYKATRGKSVAKVDAYRWEIVDEPGKFQQISKHDLLIDPAYQRSYIKWDRVLRIAAKWSWLKFGCIVAVRRPDGKLYVIDGQHRKLAADKRADIDKLPCLVFEMDRLSEEAKGFLGLNAERTAVQMIDRWNAMLITGDPITRQVQDIFDEAGYHVARSDGPYKVRCVSAVYRAMEGEPDCCRRTWKVCVEVADGATIMDFFFVAMFHCEKHLAKKQVGSLADKSILPRLKKIGLDTLTREILNAKRNYVDKTWAGSQGVIHALNRGRRVNRLPDFYADDND